MNTILFLDIDGVLNRCGADKAHLHPEKVDLLKSIIHETGCGFVVSSTWRILRERMFELKRALGADTLEHWMGCTPYFGGRARGDEISHWLSEHRDVKKFVILDDDSDMGDLMPHLVRTHCFTGLTPEIAEEVKKRLLT